MPELYADIFVSVDGSASGTRSPGYFGYDRPRAPELDRHGAVTTASRHHGPEDV